MKTLIRKANTYDVLNQIFWSEDILRTFTLEIGCGYVFDESDKCVYWENYYII
jgi:hypothetical protein